MTNSERAAIRAQAFKEAVEIARQFQHAAAYDADFYTKRRKPSLALERRHIAEGCNVVAEAIEAAAKGGQK